MNEKNTRLRTIFLTVSAIAFIAVSSQVIFSYQAFAQTEGEVPPVTEPVSDPASEPASEPVSDPAPSEPATEEDKPVVEELVVEDPIVEDTDKLDTAGEGSETEGDTATDGDAKTEDGATTDESASLMMMSSFAAAASASPLTIVATSIVCDSEADLPNWGDGGPTVTASTAADYVAAHPSCRLASGWQFQWGFGYDDSRPTETVKDPGGSYIGPVPGGTGTTGWNTFGPTGSDGKASVQISELYSGARNVWVREALQSGYIEFSEPAIKPVGSKDNVSAEMYCGSDVLNYDNYDAYFNAQLGNTYNCVAFNVSKTPPPPTNVCSIPEAENRAIFEFDMGGKKLQSNGSLSDQNNGTRLYMKSFDFPLPAGTYDVTLESFDGYTGRSSVTGQDNESYVLAIKAAGNVHLATTSPTTDLADRVDYAKQTNMVNTNLVLSSPVTKMVAYHAAGYGRNGRPHSVIPVCAAFDLKSLAPASPSISISLVGSTTINVTVGTPFNDPGVTATTTDGSSYTIASSTSPAGGVQTNATGTYMITYTATSATAGSASTTRTVNVVATTTANTPPVITILGDNPVTITVGNSYTDAGATANDAEDGDLTSSIVSTSTVATSTVGTYTVTYTVTDSGGLTSTSTRTVNVVSGTTGGGGSSIGTGGGGGVNFGTGGGFGTPLLASAGGSIAPTAQLSCPLLNSYLRYGANNDPGEMVKLQAFLLRTQGLDVDVNGFFDEKTLAAVHAFQTKYLSEVMGPWDATQSSGYVYITTRKMINLIACQSPFIIMPAEQAIIDQYKAQVNAAEAAAPGSAPTTSPDIGFNDTGTATSSSNIAGAAGAGNTASAADAPILKRFWEFLKRLLRLDR